MERSDPGDVTRLLVDWSRGDERAMDRLTPLVYDELRRVAGCHLRSERASHTLQTTALVHETYLRMMDQRHVDWRGKLHFIALASQMMRRILVDYARSRRAEKRGGDAAQVPLEDVIGVIAGRPAGVVELDDALAALAEVDEQLVRVVELRYFGGLNNDEIAEVLGVSLPTVTRRWRTAKAWLFRQLTEQATDGR